VDSESVKGQLLSFYRWLIPLSMLFGILFFVGSVLFSLRLLAITAALCILFGCAQIAAARYAGRQLLERAALITCISMLAIALITAVITPSAATANAILPLIVAAIAVQYVSRHMLKATLVICWLSLSVVLLLRHMLPSDQSLDPLVIAAIEISVQAAGSALMIFLLWQHHSRLNQIVDELRVSNSQLSGSRETLELQVSERTTDLQRALSDLQQRSDAQARLLAQIDQQQTTIRELTVPIIPIDDQTLIMPLVGSFDAQRLSDIQEQALSAIERQRTRLLILDITGVPVVDSHIAQGLVTVVSAARLLGTQTVLVGIRPEVAQSIVGLGLEMSELRSEASLQNALAKRAGQRYSDLHNH
jgi:rsbT co-antagonist protein RsbR